MLNEFQISAVSFIENFGSSLDLGIQILNPSFEQSSYAHYIGGDQDNTIVGTSIEDIIFGNGGNDTIDGGRGHDVLYGNGGDDLIFGREGSDVLFGDGGNDILFGGVGDDEISGGDGNDIIVGGAGENQLEGGGGSDTFVFFSDASGAHDIIYDFDLEDDRILAFGTSASDLVIDDLPDGLVLHWGSSSVELIGITQLQFENIDFLYV